MSVTTGVAIGTGWCGFLELVTIDSPPGTRPRSAANSSAASRHWAAPYAATASATSWPFSPGRGEGTILLSTHMDTVGSDRGIVPIVGDNGVIRTPTGRRSWEPMTSRGSLGASGLITVVAANPDLAHPTIYFVVSVCEEVGGWARDTSMSAR